MLDRTYNVERSSLTLRVERDLRDAFISECKARDCTASQMLRGFMRQFVGFHTPNELTRRTLLMSLKGNDVFKAKDLDDLFEQLND